MQWLEYVEVVRIVFALSVVLALAYKKIVGVTPGGMIVPGAMLLNLSISWRWFVFLLLISGVVYAFGNFILSLFALPQSTRNYALVGMSVLLSAMGARHLPGGLLDLNFVSQAGLMLPGLLAISYSKYGPVDALSGFGVVFSGTFLITAALPYVIPHTDIARLSTLMSAYAPVQTEVLLPAMVASLVAGFILSQWWNIRSGGYVVVPYLIMLAMQSPGHFGITLLEIGLVWLIMQQIMRMTLVIGLERFALATIISIIVVTIGDYFVMSRGIESYSASVLLLPIAVAVIVNDLSLREPVKVLSTGIPVSMAFSFAAILISQGVMK